MRSKLVTIAFGVGEMELSALVGVDTLLAMEDDSAARGRGIEEKGFVVPGRVLREGVGTTSSGFATVIGGFAAGNGAECDGGETVGVVTVFEAED
jgi:hypothetical protein